MDAHIALIISEYLPLNPSNVFLATLNLSEDVVTYASANDIDFLLSITPSRRLEIICALGYPSSLIITTDDFHAAIKCVDEEGSSDDATKKYVADFDRLGDYVRRYPRGVARTISRNMKKFEEYIISRGGDIRYVDFLYMFSIPDIHRFMTNTKLPEWSLNHHFIDPSLDNLVAIIKKVRLSLSSYCAAIVHHNCYVSYNRCRFNSYCHEDIFLANYEKFIDTFDDLIVLALATFDTPANFGEWLSHQDIWLDNATSRKLRKAVMKM